MQQTYFSGSGNVGSRITLNTRKGKGKDGQEISVLNFSLRQQVQRKTEDGSYKDVDGFWIDVEQWGRMAELNHKLLRVGCHVFVSGMIYQKEWEMTQGENAGKTSRSMALRADSVAFGALGIETIVFSAKAGRAPDSAPQDNNTPAAGDPPF